MYPLLGCPKTNEKPIFSGAMTRLLNLCEYEVELFEDRVVGSTHGEMSYICLEDDICFEYELENKKIWF